MEVQEDNVEILARELVRRYTDELEGKQRNSDDLCEVERATVVEKDQNASSQELDFWLKQLDLEKNPS